MAGGVTPKRGLIVGINVTPLVDITLVLLVVFIVTSKIVMSPAVPLDLPTASEGSEVQIIFSVLLPLDGSIYINGGRISGLDELERRARAELKERPDLRAVIQADGAVPHQQIISALNSLKRAGLSRVAFGALPEAK